MTASTAIPAAIDSYVALLAASSSLTGVQILDGPPLTDLALDYVTIGWDPFTDAGATSSQQPAQLGRMARQEDFEINCYAQSSSGDVGTSARRARAYALVDACVAVVSADPTLGGVLTQWANLAGMELRQERTASGRLDVGVTFKIECHTRNQP
jgi:hypothetical protein